MPPLKFRFGYATASDIFRRNANAGIDRQQRRRHGHITTVD